MKRVRINVGKVGLVFKNGDFRRVITAGRHWLTFNETVQRYDMALSMVQFPVALEIMLLDAVFAAMVDVIDVLDGEIVVVYKNEKFSHVLEVGRYVFWKGMVNYEFTRVDLKKIYITESIDKSLFARYELAKYIRNFEVGAGEKALLIVDDVFIKELAGGTYRFWKNDTSIHVAKADMRRKEMEVAGQELLTKDKATIRINFTTQFKIVDLKRAMLENTAFEKQLYTVMQLALRSFVGTMTLDELLENKTKIANAVFEDTKAAAGKLGVLIMNCGIKDVILTGEMKDIMNHVLVAQKTAQANVITRREETAGTRSLLNTAKLMEDNEMLYKLKEMEFVEKIAEKIGEISVTGNGGMIKQLKEIFAVSR